MPKIGGEIPDWFDLNNYLKPMTDEEWALNIYARSIIFIKGRFRDWKRGREIFSELKTGNFSKEHLLDKLPKDYLENFQGFASRDLKLTEEKDQPISVISVNQAISRTNELVNDFYRSFTGKTGENEKYSNNEYEKTEIGRFIKESMYEEQNLIAYSLEYKDDEIIKAIKKHLKENRQKSFGNFIYQDNVTQKLQEFQQFRLLALFDLLYWKEIEEPKLSYTSIGAAVWPEDIIEIDQRIRKKGIPLIESIFHKKVAQKIYQKIESPKNTKIED